MIIQTNTTILFDNIYVKIFYLRMKSISKRELAQIGESLAAQYLSGLNYNVLRRNFYSAYGEIDIVALNEKELVFVEVKTRSRNVVADAVNSITLNKQRKITKTAKYFIYRNPEFNTMSCRFDSIIVLYNKIDNTFKVHHQLNAFIPENSEYS